MESSSLFKSLFVHYSRIILSFISFSCIFIVKPFITLLLENILTFKVIKEKRATFVPTNEILNKRPSIKTSVKNLFAAGDWVDTGLPSTIESAVKSGKMVSEIIAEISG